MAAQISIDSILIILVLYLTSFLGVYRFFGNGVYFFVCVYFLLYTCVFF